MKKILKNTVGVSVASVGISEANKIPQYGGVIGTTMALGTLKEVAPKEEKRRKKIIFGGF